MAWWFSDPEPSVELHSEALRRAAKKLEALDANGWTMTDTDGEHVYFKKSLEDLDEHPFKISLS